MNPTPLALIDRFSALRVLVVGDVMVDRYVHGGAQRLCREAPAPVFEIASTTEAGGGAANVALNCAALGAATTLIGTVGDDEPGRRLLRALEAAGVRPAMPATPDCETAVKVRYCAGDRVLFRADEGGSGQIPDPAALIQVVRATWQSSDLVLISDYGRGVVGEAVIVAVNQLQRANPRLLAVDSHDLARLRDLAPTVVKPNFAELLALLGRPPVDRDRIEFVQSQRDEILRRTGARITAVTLDGDGAVVFEREGAAHVTPGLRRPEPHTVGAGDTYLAGLCLALAAGADCGDAAGVAAGASAVAVRKPFTATCSATELQQEMRGRTSVYRDRAPFGLEMARLHREGQRIVFTNGCFDILHSGHVGFLRHARSLGDVLVVALNTDESVTRLKGEGRPINDLEERLAVLSALECVDYLVVYAEDRPYELLRAARPHLYVKGGDYRRDMLPEVALAESLGCRVEILPYIENKSTARVLERIRRAEHAGAHRG